VRSSSAIFATAMLAASILTVLPCNAAPQAVAKCPARSTTTLIIGGSTLCVFIDDDTPAAQQRIERTWVQRSAAIVLGYYAQFPAHLLILKLQGMDGHGIAGGRTTNDAGLMIQVRVGRDTSAEELAQDWVLVHEMVHLAFPDVGDSHNWLAEGLAVYVEGIARAQYGNRTVADVWAEDRRAMPKGLPQTGEGGMDQTHTWARTYWGGALFCLQADIAIREQTANHAGLQQALRAILVETGGYASQRDISEVLRIGDAATKTHVLYGLYQQSRSTAQKPDLNLMWMLLGVPEDPATEPFDDHAPLAVIRQSITAAP
jgi:hypothetical protein